MDKYVKNIFFMFIFCFCSFSYGGNQKYEELKHDTMIYMSSYVSDVSPKFSSFDSIADETSWMVQMDGILKKYVKDSNERFHLLKTVHYEALRAGLDPELVLGLMLVESGFKKYAFSDAGAIGYMQVMPFWKDLIGAKNHDLFYTRINLRYGCTILRHYISLENNNLIMALGRYNGSRGDYAYPMAVLSAARMFKYNG